MPALKNFRYEAFSQELYRGLKLKGYARSNSAAYSRAGYTTHRPSAKVQACRLLQACPAILERVHELMGDVSKTITPESIVAELETARAMAEKNERESAMVAASLGKARVLGLEAASKTEIGRPGEFDYSSTQSAADFAKAYLMNNLGLSVEAVTPVMVEQGRTELERHARALENIAASASSEKVSNIRGSLTDPNDFSKARPH